MFRQLMNRIASAEPAPPWGAWGAIGALIASFAALLVGSTIAAVTVTESQYYLLVGWSLGAALAIAFVWFTRRDVRYWPALRLGTNTESAFWFLLIGVGLAILLDIVGRGVTRAIVPDPELVNVYYWAQIYGEPIQISSWIFSVLFMVILQPIAEGLVFQGLLLPSLRARIGAWPGFLLAAAVFGVFHFLAYQPPPAFDNVTMIWVGLVAPIISGVIYGAVRVYTGSTRAAILTHMAFGLFAIVKLLTLVGR